MTLFDDLNLGSLQDLSLAGFEYWITLGINIILSTIVSGIVLMVIVGILSRKYGEGVEFGNAFIMALVVNIINFFGIVGILGMFLPLPFIGLFLPLIVWIALSKFFFPGMNFFHVLMLAVIGYFLSIVLVPPIAAIIRGLIPL